MSTTDSSPEISTVTPYTEQPEVVEKDAPNDSMIGFFAVGMVINVVLITVFFIWAYKQWNKSDKPDE